MRMQIDLSTEFETLHNCIVVVVVVATTPQWSGTEGVDSTMWRFRRHV